VYPQYKEARGPSAAVPALDDAFQLVHDVVLPLLASRHYHIVAVPRLEADDIVGIAARAIQSRDPDASIVIVSADKDLVQLSAPNTTQHAANGSPVASPPDPAAWLLAHVIQGDRCDGVPPCFADCGPKRAEKLSVDPDALAKRMAEPGARERFERNKTLIDLSRIPEELVAEATAKLQLCLPSLLRTTS
jgi:hypothetical protein